METRRPARFSQAAVANSSQQRELLAAQNTLISEWTILVGAGTLLTSQSSVVNEATGEKFAITGRVARRPEKHPKFLAASARLISDLQ